MCRVPFLIQCFNTQPPEGGWVAALGAGYRDELFQHTAARRRLVGTQTMSRLISLFQHTAARRRLAEFQAA